MSKSHPALFLAILSVLFYCSLSNHAWAVFEASEIPDEESPKSIVIKKGMTLFKISNDYYGNHDRIAEISNLNRLKNPNRIFEGQTLFLPDVPDSVQVVQTFKKVFQKSKSFNLTLAKSLRDAGEIKLSTGKLNNGLKLLHDAREKNPNDPTSWISELRALILLKNQPEAFRLKEAFLERFPGFSSLLFFQSITKSEEKTIKSDGQSR